MRQLVDDRTLRDSVARAGHEYWRQHHTLDAMAEDYRRVLALAASMAPPSPADLPAHFTADYSELATGIANRFQVSLDVLRKPPS